MQVVIDFREKIRVVVQKKKKKLKSTVLHIKQYTRLLRWNKMKNRVKKGRVTNIENILENEFPREIFVLAS